MKKRFYEWLSIQLVKNPGKIVLVAILLFNVMFFLLSATIISSFNLSGTEKMSFLKAAYCTITMILDAGCIQFVIEDIGTANATTAIICMVIIIIGMISFTGAVIGYVTNYISKFIESSDSGKRKLIMSGHTVILNWNTRASEIINDLLYCGNKQDVVVLVKENRDEIIKEISERLSDTVTRENLTVKRQSENMPFFEKWAYRKANHFKNRVNYVVKEGDVFSSKQLRDISLENARAVIILGNDINSTVCKYEKIEVLDKENRGNSQTIKTLMQVADITASEYSADKQKIIVEITDEWTSKLVDRIIDAKQVEGKCNIVPLHVNHILGQILSQFSIMPELNSAYNELFSNKGIAFYSEEADIKNPNDIHFVRKYLEKHKHAIPLTFMEGEDVFDSKTGKHIKEKPHFYFAAGSEKDLQKESSDCSISDGYSVKLNRDYWIVQKNVIILGHNSKCREIMEGFNAFRNEWNYKDGGEIVRVVAIDDKASLEKFNYYKDYPFVIETIEADIFDKEKICDAIIKFVDSNEDDTSVLILSNDSAPKEDIDANALANLIYVQEIKINKKRENPDFDLESIDVIVEIIDPKHYDIVNSYSVNNVIISNRYISKMITQIGEKEAIYNFYADILTYDDVSEADGEEVFESKEIYAKKVDRFFEELPEKTTVENFIRAVFEASVDESIPEADRNPTVALGYVKHSGELIFFSGNQSEQMVELDWDDKIIVFSNH